MGELRELDAQVAKVIGWKNVTVNRIDSNWITVYGGKPDWMTWPDFWQLQEANRDQRHVPHYSSDIAAAFQVRQRMRELGFTFRLSDADNGHSACSFFHDDVDRELAGAAVAETDALAICLAALEAVKEKVLAAGG